MSRKGKISLLVFLLLLALIVLVHVQARRVVLALVETQAADSVEARIGTLQLLPFKQTIRLKDVSVSINDSDSTGFRKASVKSVHLELGSLWAFFFGGTLVIEKMECDGGELTMMRKPVRKQDTTTHVAFDLRAVFDRLRKNAIRFRIQEMTFKDFNLTLLNDSLHPPTLISHFQFRARDLYLSADSVMKRKPYIEFGLPAQQIELRDGPTTIRFDTLFFSTTDNSIQINDVEVVTSDQESGSDYRINSDKVRVAYFDFESLYTKGIAIVDTVFLGNSKLEATIKVEDTGNAKKKRSEYQSLPYLMVRHLEFRQLAAEVQLKRGKIGNSFSINNSLVSVQHLKHHPDSTHRFSARHFDILLSDYETFLNNKNTTITFDTIRLHSHGISLLNFELSKADQLKPILQAPVFELKEVDWYTLLFQKKLIAEEAVAMDPIVSTTIHPPAGSGAADQELIVLKSLKELLDVNLFSLNNATANLNFEKDGTSLSLRGVNASILTNQMIQATTFNETIDATRKFSFRNMILVKNGIKGRVDNFTFQQGKFTLENVAYQDLDSGIDLNLTGFNADRVSYDQEQVNISGLGWRLATIHIVDSSLVKSPDTKKHPFINLSMIRGGNTELNYSANEMMVHANFSRLNANGLQWGNGIVTNGLDVAGSDVNYQKSADRVFVKSFSFSDTGSVANDLDWKRIGEDTLGAYVDQIRFVTDFNLLARQQVYVPVLDVLAMRAYFSRGDSVYRVRASAETNFVINDLRYVDKKLTVGSLHQTIDSLYFENVKRVTKDVDNTADAPVNERWKIRHKIDSLLEPAKSAGIPAQRRIGGGSDNASEVSPFSTESTRVETQHKAVVLSVSDIETFLHDSSTHIKASLDSIGFSAITIHRNDIDARVEHGVLKKIELSSDWIRDPREVLNRNYVSMTISNLKFNMETVGNVVRVDRLDYDPLQAKWSIRGFEHRPRKDKKTFLDESFFQTNYMHTTMESISLHQLDATRFAEDSTIRLRSIRIKSPGLQIDRDKTHPFYSSKIKLLPTNAFQNIGVRFSVDSLQFQDGHIVYTEKSKVTGKEGSIHFTEVQGLVRNIRNTELKVHDSLFIEAYARFLDSANVNLRVRESYHDTLAGFLMTTQVSPFHTSILNPVLVPLVSVEFQSGLVDTLQMHAIGREHVSAGQMKFLYRDLKVNFLDQNDTSRHSFRNYIIKFAANNLVIRSNNKKRIGDVFELRDRNRAVFQYWVKMILSGVTTSVGAKSNRAQSKKYLKELNTRKLPPIKETLAGF